MNPTHQPPATITPQIHTYHCLCTNVLLATTYSLPDLHRRAAPSIDKPYILPCPPHPSNPDPDSDSEDSETPTNFTLLVSLLLPPRQTPLLIRRVDGYEKRWLLRCGRCRLVVAYQLDWSQYKTEIVESAAGEEGKSGRRENVVYILPGAVMTTEEMVKGKKLEEKDVGFELEGK